MQIDNFLKNVASLFIICGALLFWYVDWYWVVVSYNIVFSYLSFSIYRDYNDNPRFRNKIPLIFYIGLPLVLNFVGFLISIINGFEEIPESEIQAMKNIDKSDLDEVFENKSVKTSLFDKFKK